MPTRDGVVTAILAGLLLFVAFNLQAGWVYAIVALLAGLLGVGAATARVGRRAIHVVRTAPVEAFAGEQIAVSLTLQAERWPQLFLHLHDQTPGLEPVAAAFIPLLWPGRAATVTYQTTALRRGEYRGGRVVLLSYGLTGLFRTSQTVDTGGHITIFPAYWALRNFPVPGRDRTLAGGLRRRSRSGGEFHGIREYREGDSLRRVHWRSTARRGRLIVREFEDETSGAVTLLLDTRAACADAVFEDLVKAAASVAYRLTQGGGSVRIVAAQRGAVVDVWGGWKDALRALARVALDTDAGSASIMGAAGIPAQSPAVLFTSDADAAVQLDRRGHPLVVVLAGMRQDAELILRALGIPACAIDPANPSASLESVS